MDPMHDFGLPEKKGGSLCVRANLYMQRMAESVNSI